MDFNLAWGEYSFPDTGQVPIEQCEKKDELTMRASIYSGEQIFSVRACEQIVHNPLWADLRIESNKCLTKEYVCGAGLYAIHYINRLVYIGQFRGTKKTPYAGDVCATRWAKHLGTLTLRDRRISFGPRAMDEMHDLRRVHGPLPDILQAREWPTISSHRGRVSSINRALFAEEYWESFARIADANDLADFKITYVQLDSELHHSHQFIRAAIESAEKLVIAQLRPRCNADIPAGTSHDADIKEVTETLVAALESTVNGETRQAVDQNLKLETNQVDPHSMQEEGVQVNEMQNEQIDDCGTMTAEEAFLERLGTNQDAHLAVDRLLDAFAEIADAYVWHTLANLGDMRIRRIRNSSTFSNVACIYWQRKLKRFSSEISLSTERCLELGASSATPNYARKTLPTLATFRIPEATDGLIACLIEAAEQNPR